MSGLVVRDLAVEFRAADGVVPAVRGVGFSIRPGEVLGVIGESGCGKSSAALSLLGLLARPEGRVVSGSAHWNGRDLLGLSEAELRRVRGREIGMVFQDPLTALHPAMPILRQLTEAIRAHEPQVHRDAARDRAIRRLRAVGIPRDAIERRPYAHAWSGGMRQRAMIALATLHDPGVLIADEPTTALDVTTQARVLDLLRESTRAGRAVMLITHDLSVIAELADRVAVMYAGRLIETAGVHELFARPRHPYTAALLASRPGIPGGLVPPLAGRPPDPRDLPAGCEFRPRCFLGGERDQCAEQRPALEASAPNEPDGCVACHFSDEVPSIEPRASAKALGSDPARPTGPPILTLEGVSVEYPVAGSRSRHHRSRTDRFRAVDSVSFELDAGEVLALVGESGCGKSSLARALVGLEPLSAGRVRWRDVELARHGSRSAAVRREIQIVFQDPYASLNPRCTIGSIVTLGARVHGLSHRGATGRQAAELLERVGLDRSIATRYPHELSGGQRQRVAIARALAVEPAVLLLDEPVTSLDVSVQKQILDLLARLRDDIGVAMLLIAHDLSLVRAVADRVLVMDRGRIVESGAAETLFAGPAHHRTRSLLAAAPIADPRRRRQKPSRDLA